MTGDAGGEGGETEGHVVKVVYEGSKTTRWMLDIDGEYIVDGQPKFEEEEFREARCSCGRRFESEGVALEHLEEVEAGGRR